MENWLFFLLQWVKNHWLPTSMGKKPVVFPPGLCFLPVKTTMFTGVFCQKKTSQKLPADGPGPEELQGGRSQRGETKGRSLGRFLLQKVSQVLSFFFLRFVVVLFFLKDSCFRKFLRFSVFFLRFVVVLFFLKDSCFRKFLRFSVFFLRFVVVLFFFNNSCFRKFLRFSVFFLRFVVVLFF